MSPSARTPPAVVRLIPWDPESPAHIERMYEQRIACGWKAEHVEEWRGLQREGKITLQWVALDAADPDLDEKVQKHAAAYPKQATPLLDTAISLGGKPIEATKQEFVPIGHISLNTEYEELGYTDPSPGLYFIATFWVSTALQGAGIGRAAMDAVEHMAISEPLNAKVLALSTATRKDGDMREDKWAALGVQPPVLSNQDWYERRGYVVYKTVDQMWNEKDKTGKVWWTPAVFMRKEIS